MASAPRAMLLAVLSVVSAGCGPLALVGLAGGPAFGVLSMVGNRSVERTVGAGRETAWSAALATLGRSGLEAREIDRGGETWRIVAGSTQVTAHLELVAVAAGLTRVSARVETGGLVADRETAAEILAKLDRAVLAAVAEAAGTAPRPDASPSNHAALTDENRRLRSEIEVVRATTARTAPAAAPVIVDTGAIVTVPTSVGVPVPVSVVIGDGPESRGRSTTTGPRDAPSAREDAAALGEPVGRWAPGETLAIGRRAPGETLGAGRLMPVETLTPAPTLLTTSVSSSASSVVATDNVELRTAR